LEVCIDKFFEDMRPKVARGLVKLLVMSYYEFFEILTPAIATDFISDILERVRRVLESCVKMYADLMLW
jgi:hypothetical protein